MSKFHRIKEKLKPNKPVKSYKPEKKMMVKAVQDGKEKLIHFGDSGYKSNYSDDARENFRARHNCEDAKDKLTARYWSCSKLWQKNSPVIKKVKK